MMSTHEPIGYTEALKLTLDNICPLQQETIPLMEATDRVVAMDLPSLVDSPSVDASLKDGYAIHAEEITDASPENPVYLKIIGLASPGHPFNGVLLSGTAVRILTGAKIPDGANAVVSEEFTSVKGDVVVVLNNADRGRNVLTRGSDVTKGELLTVKGTRLSPGFYGILVASGYSDIPVYKRPEVAIIATGDEVIMPGKPLPEGKLYASNLATLNSWCNRYGIRTVMDIAKDNPGDILNRLSQAVKEQDVILTSGGAWTGDRDFVVQMLEELGWRQFFHRIRIGPGKGVGFGILENKPVFILPGGPPSNLLAFLEIALPALHKLSGLSCYGLSQCRVRLEKSLTVRDKGWTQFIFGKLIDGNDFPIFRPIELKSRLQSMALAEAVITVPEGIEKIERQSILTAQSLL